MMKFLPVMLLLLISACGGSGQANTPPPDREPPPESVARIWNEALLDAIRRNVPHPPAHARNLFHLSVAMYDGWAVYDPVASGYLTRFKVPIDEAEKPWARAETISYAAYRVLKARFVSGPGAAASQAQFDETLTSLGYDIHYTSTTEVTPAALGNLIAATVLTYGHNDGSNEAGGYSDVTYSSVNPSLITELSGTSLMSNPNRWQPLAFDYAETQNGIPIGTLVQPFVGARWGRVTPFALRKDPGDLSYLYIDPGPPYMLDALRSATLEEFHDTVIELIQFSSTLTPDIDNYIDISPGAMGNNPLGTDNGEGYAVNPVTGEPYTPQLARVGDVARVLATFWADGPHSETPPGHWNVLANEVGDYPGTVLQIGGTGNAVSRLEWDVKLYLALNGAVHDAAVACWGIKRHYDSSRPISFIRYMAEKGQSSDPELPSYDFEGLPLVDGLIELITEESAAPGQRHEHLSGHIGKIAVRSWLGAPEDRENDYGGVGWILAVDWFPYQLPSFISPAFPGYTSGHSTFSRAAAEVLAAFTGSPWVPGGLGEFRAEAGQYLHFEYGPSEDVVLQWASYYDAADQAGISRRLGGIHPYMDDYPSRIIGSQVGIQAWELAQQYFNGENPELAPHLPPLPGPALVLDVPTIPKEPVEKPAYEIPNPGECSIVAAGTYRTSPPEPDCEAVSLSCDGAGGVEIERMTPAVTSTYGAYIHVDTNLDPADIEVRIAGQLATRIFKDPQDDSRGALYLLPRPGDTHLPHQCPVRVAVRLVDAEEDDDCRELVITRPHFEDVADVVGLTFFHYEGSDPQPYAAGIAFGDFDNDGDLDIYLSNFDLPGQFFLNLGDLNGNGLPDFEDATEAVGLADIDKGVSVAFIDYDNDGDRDLFIGRQGYSMLMQNQLIETGNASFIDGTEEAGLDGFRARVAGQAWGDYDGDGDLDLYLSTHAAYGIPMAELWLGERLLRNDGGAFVDVTETTLAPHTPFSPTFLFGFAAMWIDVDLDGDLDLLVTSDHENQGFGPTLGLVHPNVIWRNDGPGVGEGEWIFTNVTEDSGWAYFPDAKGQGLNAMGLSTGDLNGDGLPDFAMSNIGPNYLLLNSTDEGSISFEDISDYAGIRRTYLDWQPETPGTDGADAWFDMSVTWGTHLFDANADGYLDLFFAGGAASSVFGPRPIPNALFINRGDNTYDDLTWESGTLDNGSSIATSIADIDQDGFPDLAVANVDGKFRMYLNVTPQNGNTNHWLQVDLMGTASNRDAIGSIVRVTTPDDRMQTCFVVSQNGLGSGSELTCQFGLGSHEEIAALEIQWPDGTVTHPEVPAVDSRILCKEPEDSEET